MSKRLYKLVSVSPDEKTTIARAASLYGLPFATYVRFAALEHAKEFLKKAEVKT